MPTRFWKRLRSFACFTSRSSGPSDSKDSPYNAQLNICRHSCACRLRYRSASGDCGSPAEAMAAEIPAHAAMASSMAPSYVAAAATSEDPLLMSSFGTLSLPRNYADSDYFQAQDYAGSDAGVGGSGGGGGGFGSSVSYSAARTNSVAERAISSSVSDSATDCLTVTADGSRDDDLLGTHEEEDEEEEDFSETALDRRHPTLPPEAQQAPAIRAMPLSVLLDFQEAEQALVLALSPTSRLPPPTLDAMLQTTEAEELVLLHSVRASIESRRSSGRLQRDATLAGLLLAKQAEGLQARRSHGGNLTTDEAIDDEIFSSPAIMECSAGMGGVEAAGFSSQRLAQLAGPSSISAQNVGSSRSSSKVYSAPLEKRWQGTAMDPSRQLSSQQYQTATSPAAPSFVSTTPAHHSSGGGVPRSQPPHAGCWQSDAGGSSVSRVAPGVSDAAAVIAAHRPVPAQEGGPWQTWTGRGGPGRRCSLPQRQTMTAAITLAQFRQRLLPAEDQTVCMGDKPGESFSSTSDGGLHLGSSLGQQQQQQPAASTEAVQSPCAAGASSVSLGYSKPKPQDCASSAVFEAEKSSRRGDVQKQASRSLELPREGGGAAGAGSEPPMQPLGGALVRSVSGRIDTGTVV